MQRKGIERRNTVWQVGVPGDLPNFGDQLERGGRQSGHMQRLANVAGSVRASRMLVEIRAAGGEIQESDAANNG